MQNIDCIWWHDCWYALQQKTYPMNLFIRGRKLEISLLITQSYFAMPKNVRLNSTHYFIMKIPNKRELEQIASNHSSDKGHYESIQKMHCKTIFFLVKWCNFVIR